MEINIKKSLLLLLYLHFFYKKKTCIVQVCKRKETLYISKNRSTTSFMAEQNALWHLLLTDMSWWCQCHHGT